MFCRYCGNQLVDEARFCSKCGNAVDTPENNTNEVDNSAADGNAGMKAVAVVLAIVFLISAIALPFVYYSTSSHGQPDNEKSLLEEIYVPAFSKNCTNVIYSACRTCFVVLTLLVLLGVAFLWTKKYALAAVNWGVTLLAITIFYALIRRAFESAAYWISPEYPTAMGPGMTACLLISAAQLIIAICCLVKQRTANDE